MVNNTRNRSTANSRFFPTSLTPFRKGVANRLIAAMPLRPSPLGDGFFIITTASSLVNSCRLRPKLLLSALDKAGVGAYNKNREAPLLTVSPCVYS